jgi:surface polysaccharide O-acyltransferase-like enzyme
MAWLKDCLSSRRLAEWILFCKNPFSVHLWYLMAILTVYILVYLYVRWKGKDRDNSALYMVSAMLFCIHFLTGAVSAATDIGISRMFYRNALFFGFPMVILGMFLREYRDRLIETYALSAGKLILLIVAGAAFSVLQWRGMGTVEMPLGTLVEVVALMLLLTSVPEKKYNCKVCRFLTAKAGELSTFVYVTHMMWSGIYAEYVAPHLDFLGKTVSRYLAPVMVVLISIASGMAWITVKGLAQKILRQFPAGNRGSV